MRLRRCRKCKEEKPIDRFRVYKYRVEDGLRESIATCCLDCYNKQKREAPDRICKQCGEKKPITDYRIVKSGRSLKCKPCEYKIKKEGYSLMADYIKLRYLNPYLAGLDTSHSAIPCSHEGLTSLRVYLDQ